MRSFGPLNDTLVAKSAELRYLIELRFDDLNVAAFSSHPDVTSWPGAVVYPSTLTGRISETSNEIEPEEHRSMLGALTFEVLDRGGAVSADLGARLASSFALRKTVARLYVGQVLDTWAHVLGPFYDARPVATLVVDGVEFERSKGIYRFRCVDAWARAKTKIFKVRRSKLTQGLTPTLNGVAVESFEGFEMVPHNGHYSDAPNLTAGYLRVGDELIRYETKSTPGYDVFHDLYRGAFNTIPEGAEAAVEVSEVIYIEELVLDVVCLVLTGRRRSGGAVWPSTWHAGFDRDTDLVLSTFEAANVGSDVAGVVCRFVLHEEETAKTFLEQEVLPLIGCILRVDAEGRLGLKRLSGVVNGASHVMELDTDNVIRVGKQKYAIDRVKNDFLISWNPDPLENESVTRHSVVSTDSVNRNGAETLERTYRGLHGSIHTTQILDWIVDWHRNRVDEPPYELEIVGKGVLARLEPGDVVRLVVAGMPDFAGEDTAQVERSYEVRGVRVDWRTKRVTLKLFGSTSEPAALVGGLPGPVLVDGFYPGEGSPLPGVSDGVLTEDTFVNGGSDLTAGGSIFYVDGNLTIPSGITLTIQNNVQVRVRGVLVLDGTIDGRGGGHLGAAVPSSPATGVWIQGGDGHPPTGTPGFVGASQASGGREYAYGDSLNPSVAGDPYASPSSIRAGAWRISPVTEGLHRSAPQRFLWNTDGTSFSGIPTDLRGTSGGPGEFARIVDAYSNAPQNATLFEGGTGGPSGAGLAIVCRGIALGANGRIRLDGFDGVAAPSNVANARAGGGAAGSGGACYVFLDGAATTETGLRAGFSSVTGQTPHVPETDQPTGAAGISQVDNSDAHFRVQYIPAPAQATPTPPPRVYGALDCDPAIGFLFEDSGGSADLAAFNANKPRLSVRGVHGDDLSSIAVFALENITNDARGTATVSFNPTSGEWTVTSFSGHHVVITWRATVRGTVFYRATPLLLLSAAALPGSGS